MPPSPSSRSAPSSSSSASSSSGPAPLSSRTAELENSRLGVIYFLGNLQVTFSPEASATEMKNKALALLQSKVGDGRIMTAANKVGAAVEAVDRKVDAIAESIGKWLVEQFHVAPDDARLAVEHVRYNLPALIYGIQGAARDTGAIDSGATAIASGLYTAITRTIEYFNLRHAGSGVVLETGHPDIVAASIRRSVVKSALVGLAEAALAAAKAALAAASSGAGVIINKVAGVIEQLLRFAVRLCDALTLRKVFADAREKWACHKQPDAIQTKAVAFADWFQQTVGRAAVVAALVMNCGIAGDAMRFLRVVSGEGAVVTQGQFDKGVTYLNALKSSAGDLIQQIQQDMRVWSADPMTASLLKHSGEIGYVQKEANSSWRSRIFAWSNQGTKKSQALNWVLDKVGYKQSTAFGRG
jgi:hypothetical protein